MMASIQPLAPHLVSTPGLSAGAAAGVSAATSPSPLSSGAATPSAAPSAADILAYTGMNLLPDLDFTVVPPALDPALLPTPTVANHLRAARLRLLPDLPGSFHGLSSQNSMWSWWCSVCGALPEGWTATEKGTLTGSGSRTPGGRKKKKKSSKRVADDELQTLDVESINRQLEQSYQQTFGGGDGGFRCDLKRSFGELSSDDPTSLPPARRPPSSPLDRRRKPAACNTCGSEFARPRPTITLHPARLVARTRASAQQPPPPLADSAPRVIIQVNNTGPSASPISPTDAAPVPEPMPDLAAFDPTTAPPLFHPDMIRAPHPPNLWNTPSLQHIPMSPGDLPTYPLPPVVPPPTSNGSSPPVKIPPGGGQPPPAKKRKKKSGLAKLLAQNAEREQENKGSGNWGLG